MNWFNLITSGHDFDQINPRSSIISQSSFNILETDIHIIKLPSLISAPNSEKENLFVTKLYHCCKIFNFLDPGVNAEEIELKSQILMELSNFISSPSIEFSLETYEKIIEMFSKNIFRMIHTRNNNYSEFTDMEPALEASWPHMKLVYLFFMNFLNSSFIDQNKVSKVINNEFVSRIIDMFNSEDHRERNQLKVILHKIYAKFVSLREYINCKMKAVCLSAVYELEHFNGISEILEIFNSIIKGFAIPLKQEHKDFLGKILLPLLKTKYLIQYYIPWISCITELMEKDPSLTERITNGVLKYWPKTCSVKEHAFLVFLENILIYVEFREFLKIQVKLFKQIANCITSFHFNISAKALNLCTIESVAILIEVNYKILMPVLVPSLCKTIKQHWNENVINLAKNVLQTLNDIDSNFCRQLIK